VGFFLAQSAEREEGTTPRRSSAAKKRNKNLQTDHNAHTGNADGLGETRKKELVKSGMTLGLRQEDDVFVVDSPYVATPPPLPSFPPPLPSS
jgi:hypothetical protein